MIRLFSGAAITIACILLFAKSTNAQGIFESITAQTTTDDETKTSLELNGYARGVAYGGSEDFDYSNVFGEFALKGRLAKQKSFLFADVRVREGVFFNERELQLQLKEAYAGYRGDKIDVFLGNQIVAWGRTDGFNPTNNITPNDYFFLTYEPDDQNLSNFMLQSRLKVTNSFDIEIIAIPFYMPSVYRYDLFQENEPVEYLPVDLPELNFENSSVATRLNFELPLVGFSLSYFRGYDPFYGFDLQDIDIISVMPPNMNITYLPKPYFKQTIGGDFAAPIQSWIFRGEMALNITTDYKDNMNIPNPNLSYVFGIERSFLGTTTIFQYVGLFTYDFVELQSPTFTGFTPEYVEQRIIYESTLYNRKVFNQHEETNHAIFLSLNRFFFHDELSGELSGLYNITNEEQLVRGRLKWSVSDALSINIGASYMFGPENSIFRMAGQVMNGVFVGVEAVF